MANLDKMKNDIASLTEKVNKDVQRLLGTYSDLNTRLQLDLKEEFIRNSGNLEGLEDFQSLANMVKRNRQSVANMASLMRRMKNISEFNISQDDESNS